MEWWRNGVMKKTIGFGCQESDRWLLVTACWLPGGMMLDAEPLNAEPWDPVADT